MKSITQAETLRDYLADRLEWMKAEDYHMDRADWGGQEGVLISGNDAEMLFGLLCEWIETTKELIAGPETAADVNETNAARVQTRMKYKFVLIEMEKKVVCVPIEDYNGLSFIYEQRILNATSQAGREWATMQFKNACAEYPVAVHIDF